MENKIFSYFGFAKKSGNLRTGLNVVSELKKRAYLIAVCRSASENTKKDAAKCARKYGCALVESATDDLSSFVGKDNCKIVAVTEEHLADAILKNIDLDFTVLIGSKG